MMPESSSISQRLHNRRSSRVLCAWLPDFPIQRLHGERPETKATACVLYAESGNRSQVVTASSKARHHGIRSGMSLAEAQALIESAVFVPHDPEADALELRTLAAVCYFYSPLVGLELSNGSHCLLLDIAGCGPLFGNESGLARQLVVDLAEHGYFAHVAVANSIGAAWAIARYGHGAGADRRLRSLPVEALRIPQKLVSRLREFDLWTIGQLSALPKDSLPSRFGAVLTERLDQLYARCDELLVPVPQPEPVSDEWTTDEPICHPEAIRYVCTDLLSGILDTLNARGEGLLKLTVTLMADTIEPVVLEIGLARPNNSLPHLLTLIDLKLESAAVPEWLHTIRLEASIAAPLRIRQRGLFSREESIRDGSNVQRLTERLSARLGREAVVRSRLLPEAVPEQAVGFDPLTSAPQDEHPECGLTIASARPLILLPQPEAIRMTSVRPDGRPLSFGWKQQHYRVARCTEVERISTAWWQDAGAIRRDYCQVELSSGARFWLFRDGNGAWFLHGVFE
jgi:protein ImuB